MEVSGVLASVVSRRTLFWECGVKKLSRVRLFNIFFVRLGSDRLHNGCLNAGVRRSTSSNAPKAREWRDETAHNAIKQLDEYSIVIIVVFISMMVTPELYIDAQVIEGPALLCPMPCEEKDTGNNSNTRSQERYNFIV